MLITYILMGILILSMLYALIFEAKYIELNYHFFDVKNTTAMRGLWCIIVILVHVPMEYQNVVQDMIGSFAYIGVTFFFLTSAYGLQIGSRDRGKTVKCFWRKRLPKLIVPMLLVNIVSILVNLIKGKDITFCMLLSINSWVIWLVACYFVWWIINIIPHLNKKHKNYLVCIFVVLGSVIVYSQHDKISVATWCPEVLGFVWGIGLSCVKEKMGNIGKKKWLIILFVSCMLSVMLGLLYLKFKFVIFWGNYFLKIILGLSIISLILILNIKISIGNKVSYFLGNISYEVYLLHPIAFSLFAHIFPNSKSGLFIVGSILLTIALSCLINILSRTLIKSVYKLLLNN